MKKLVLALVIWFVIASTAAMASRIDGVTKDGTTADVAFKAGVYEAPASPTPNGYTAPVGQAEPARLACGQLPSSPDAYKDPGAAEEQIEAMREISRQIGSLRSALTRAKSPRLRSILACNISGFSAELRDHEIRLSKLEKYSLGTRGGRNELWRILGTGKVVSKGYVDARDQELGNRLAVVEAQVGIKPPAQIVVSKQPCPQGQTAAPAATQLPQSVIPQAPGSQSPNLVPAPQASPVAPPVAPVKPKTPQIPSKSKEKLEQESSANTFKLIVFLFIALVIVSGVSYLGYIRVKTGHWGFHR